MNGLLQVRPRHMLAPYENADIHPRERSRRRPFDSQGNPVNVIFNDPPVGSGDGNDGYLAASHILLILKRPVARQKDIKAGCLRCVEQFTVLQTPEPSVLSSENLESK